MADLKNITALLKAEAINLGFSGIAIAKAEHMDEEARHLEQWLNKGHHGEMSYLADHFDKRVDPTKLVAGAKSVISLMYNYYSEAEQHDHEAPKVAMYAMGKDYHKVVKKKIIKLFKWMEEHIGAVEGRCFIDSAPILERDWAKRSGLGWIGKHTLLINKNKGSYFFLGEIICDAELTYDMPAVDHCGTCTRCIEACPTDAISEQGYLLDGSKCISYLTIEVKDAIPEEFRGKMANYAFGCDICQQVCPWNRFSTPHEEPKFDAREPILALTKSQWIELTEETYKKVFEGTPVKRALYPKLRKNIDFVTKS